MRPGAAPPMLRKINCNALPIVEFARAAFENTLLPQAKPSSLRTGPLMTTSGAAKWVVPWTPWISSRSSHSARTSGTSTRMYSGRHPAMTPFAATFSTVAWP